MKHQRAAVVLLAVIAAAGCTPTRFDPASAARDLLARDSEWATAASEGRDLERILSYWSDDARVIEPGEPVYEGKAAIRAYVAASLATPGFHIHWVSSNPVFSPDGRVAYMPGVTELTVPGTDGKPMTIHMRGISVWRRDADGIWRCVVDIANAAPAGPSP